MNRFGNEIHRLTHTAIHDLKTVGIVGIETAMGLMDCGVDPRDIADVESCIPNEETQEEEVDG